MKNFSISCARTSLVLTALALLLAAPAMALKKPVDTEEIFNPLLGVEYSHWLVGPIYQMATDKEIEEYSLIVDDETAAKFVEEFWKKRNEGTDFFKKTPEQLFKERAEVADGRYSEDTFPGHLTDRGTIYVLFGEPEEVRYESSEMRDGPPLEIWDYGKKAEKGLNGEKPKKSFRFMQVDGQTTFFNPVKSEREARKRSRRRPGF